MSEMTDEHRKLLTRSRMWISVLAGAAGAEPEDTTFSIVVTTKDGQDVRDTMTLAAHLAALDGELGDENPFQGFIDGETEID